MAFSLTATPIPDHKTYRLVDTPRKLHELFEALSHAPEVAVDIETNHPTLKNQDAVREANFPPATIIGVSFSWQKDQGSYLPLYIGRDSTPFWQGAMHRVIDSLGDFLESPVPKVMQNGKFDNANFYKVLGIRTRAFTFDTMLAHHLLDETRNESMHGLKPMAAHYLDPMAAQYEQALDKALDFYDPRWRRYSYVPIDVIFPYACGDVDYTLQLKGIFQKRLEEENLTWVFDHTTMPLQHVCMISELKGLLVDEAKLAELDAFFLGEMVEAEKEAVAVIGRPINVASPEQLAEFLYQELRLPPQYNKKTKSLSTDADSLKALDGMHPAIKPLLRYRKAATGKNSYVDGIRKRLHPITRKIHPDFQVGKTLTGRLSAENPNVQNLPRPENGGAKIKAVYIAPPGHRLILTDYSQIELRVAAHLAQERVWIDAFNRGEDLHSKTAKAVFNLDCPVEDVKKYHEDKRSQAKIINFSILYGKGAHGLSKDLKLSIEEAEAMITRYFEGLPDLKRWIDSIHAQAKEKGYVANAFGRRRRVPEIRQFVPPREYKPRGAPRCWGRKDVSPPVYRLAGLKNLDLQANLAWAHVASNIAPYALQSGKPECAACPHLGSCTIDVERSRREFLVASLLREVGNFAVQSTATADISGQAFAQVTKNLQAAGIPLAIEDDVRGFSPVNVVHDELIFQVADEYVEAAQKIIIETMEGMWPECSVKLAVDSEIVRRSWGDKHIPGGKISAAEVSEEARKAGYVVFEYRKAG